MTNDGAISAGPPPAGRGNRHPPPADAQDRCAAAVVAAGLICHNGYCRGDGETVSRRRRGNEGGWEERVGWRCKAYDTPELGELMSGLAIWCAGMVVGVPFP